MSNPFGVYVHVPFCARRCDYCDFATWTDRAHLMEAYAAACVADLERHRAAGTLRPAGSVFFGGGTPSLLPAGLLCSILDAVPRQDGAEVTVECNPDTVDPGLLGAYRAAGVSRVSFGVQSMVPRVLAGLGRTHDPESVARAVGWAREAGFATYNLDLIYGGAGESPAEWRATLEAAMALDPPHVSAYALTVEAGTPLARRIDAGDVVPPDDDDQADKYVAADEFLAAAGLDWYEISNWARPGHDCRHNDLYWSQGEYLGIGCAAHGHTTRPGTRPRRWWNVRTPERYIDRLRRGESPEGGHEDLDPDHTDEEGIALGLRTRRGAAVGSDAGLVADGLASWSAGRLVLTRSGRLLANEATARLLLERERASARLPAPVRR